MNFQELKQFAGGRIWVLIGKLFFGCVLEGYIPVNIEIDYTYKINNV